MPGSSRAGRKFTPFSRLVLPTHDRAIDHAQASIRERAGRVKRNGERMQASRNGSKCRSTVSDAAICCHPAGPAPNRSTEMVRSRRLELPRAFAHNDLNVARLPVPPRPHIAQGGQARPRLVGARHLATAPRPCKRAPRPCDGYSVGFPAELGEPRGARHVGHRFVDRDALARRQACAWPAGRLPIRRRCGPRASRSTIRIGGTRWASRPILVIVPLAPKYSVPLGNCRRSCWSTGKSSSQVRLALAERRAADRHPVGQAPNRTPRRSSPWPAARSIAAAQVHSLQRDCARRRNGGAGFELRGDRVRPARPAPAAAGRLGGDRRGRSLRAAAAGRELYAWSGGGVGTTVLDAVADGRVGGLATRGAEVPGRRARAVRARARGGGAASCTRLGAVLEPAMAALGAAHRSALRDRLHCRARHSASCRRGRR